MADKKRHRSHSSPTGITPHRQSKRAPLRYSKSTAAHLEPRRLTLDATEVTAASTGTPEPNSSATAVGSRACTWTDDETRALLKFVLLYGPSDKWPRKTLSFGPGLLILYVIGAMEEQNALVICHLVHVDIEMHA